LADYLFEVKIDKKARKSYEKMPDFYKKRVLDMGKVLKENPVPVHEYDITNLEEWKILIE
jgi:mRNA-degrading endonuclease RelE of RelBE toxin-antitoxin system